jgi:hypothetical protein
MQTENAFKLGSILLLVGFSVAGANLSGSAFAGDSIRSESKRVQVTSSINVDQFKSDDLVIRREVEEVEDINKMNVTEFAPYKIR